MKDLTETVGMDENVVLFAERATRPPEVADDLTDPLQELLEEFEDISEDDELEETQVYNSALPEELLAHEFSKAHEFQKQIELIQEANKRVKYYLDELELFIPKLQD